MNDGLTNWEREFLDDISDLGDDLTEPQEEKLAEIQAKRARYRKRQSQPKLADRTADVRPRTLGTETSQ